VYIGLPNNPQFLGPQDPQELAEHILKSKGPSGENKEYLYMLRNALDDLSPESGDGHVSDLAQRTAELEARQNLSEERADAWQEPGIGSELHKVGSTEEQEEVEK
jgi:glutathione-specific gamma-glutamylcyclotransferase